MFCCFFMKQGSVVKQHTATCMNRLNSHTHQLCFTGHMQLHVRRRRPAKTPPNTCKMIRASPVMLAALSYKRFCHVAPYEFNVRRKRSGNCLAQYFYDVMKEEKWQVGGRSYQPFLVHLFLSANKAFITSTLLRTVKIYVICISITVLLKH